VFQTLAKTFWLQFSVTPIPASSPTRPTSHPFLFARARTLSLSCGLPPASRRDSPIANSDLPVWIRVQRWCFLILAIERVFFFPLLSLCFWHAWLQYLDFLNRALSSVE